MGEFDNLFAVLDRKAKLYQRKEDLLGAQRDVIGRFMPTVTANNAALPQLPGPAEATMGNDPGTAVGPGGPTRRPALRP